MEDFNTKLFISIVRSKVSIWDYKSSEFKDKIKKHKDWLAVCEGIIPNYGEKTNKEKKHIMLRLQSKWKALRDGFVRNLRNRNKKSGPAAANAKKYTYHDHMLFLIGKCKRDLTSLTYNLPNKMPEESAKKDSDSDDSVPEKDVLAEALRNSKPTERLPEVADADDDKQFLLCLLKDFKRISEDYKLDAKGDIINVIRHYVNKSNHCLRGSQSPQMDVFRGYPPQYTRTDVQNFTPEEITVKVADKCIIIGGKHEDERGFVSREFKRRYALPEDCNPGDVESRLSSDGVLTVVARAGDTEEITVPISGIVPVTIKREDGEMEFENGDD